MKIDANIRYKEEYLPTKRHRIPRIREVEETVPVEIHEVKKEDASLAMVVTDYQSYLDENGNDQFGLRDTSFYAIDGQLYSEKRDMSGALDRGSYPLSDFLREIEKNGDCNYRAPSGSKEDVLRHLHEFVDSHVLVDGVVYQRSNEPRYVVQTFGFGRNHGGTALLIAKYYNQNIGKDCYFNALQRDEAIAFADKVASDRGDTKSIGTFGDINIKVLMPEMVHCEPNLEHGSGNSLLNTLEELVQGSSNSLEAGVLVIAAASAELSSINKPSLDDQIQSASTRAAESHSNMKAINIEWDVDCQEDLEDLPTEIEIPEGMEDEEDISDYLSDVTGFCHKGFCLIESKKKSLDDRIQSASTRASESRLNSDVKSKAPEPEH